jgi:RNA 2',3'-cyclic 3'-phosphodiesterase
MTRLFVAIDVPMAARQALSDAVTGLRVRHDGLRWSRPAGWHVTLAFLGEVGVGGRIRAISALRRATVGAAPCAVTLSGRLGRFGDRVLWASVEADDDRLPTLVDGIRRELAAAGLPFDDRPFRSHLTLARGRRGQAMPRTRLLTAPGLPCRWSVATVALMASPPNGHGNGYRTVATWPLGEGRA